MYVANVSATDADVGVNAQLHYTISAGPLQNFLQMDSASGTVETRLPTASLGPGLVSTTLVATDSAALGQLAGQSSLTIEVLDSSKMVYMEALVDVNTLGARVEDLFEAANRLLGSATVVVHLLEESVLTVDSRRRSTGASSMLLVAIDLAMIAGSASNQEVRDLVALPVLLNPSLALDGDALALLLQGIASNITQELGIDLRFESYRSHLASSAAGSGGTAVPVIVAGVVGTIVLAAALAVLVRRHYAKAEILRQQRLAALLNSQKSGGHVLNIFLPDTENNIFSGQEVNPETGDAFFYKSGSEVHSAAPSELYAPATLANYQESSRYQGHWLGKPEPEGDSFWSHGNLLETEFGSVYEMDGYLDAIVQPEDVDDLMNDFSNPNFDVMARSGRSSASGGGLSPRSSSGLSPRSSGGLLPLHEEGSTRARPHMPSSGPLSQPYQSPRKRIDPESYVGMQFPTRNDGLSSTIDSEIYEEMQAYMLGLDD
jgi:hypothetical protein